MDLETAKKEFMKYVENYDATNFNIKRKIDHSLRVMAISMKIAENIELSKEDVKLAALIGLLHDIGRFEQFTQYGTYNDSKSVDHGNLGVEILVKDNFIRNFIKEATYDEIIKIAIRNHNKVKIEDGLNERQLLFCNIIRDADKLDILYQCTLIAWKDRVVEIERGKLTKENLAPFTEERVINREKDFKDIGPIKDPLVRLCFVFDINFPITFKMLKENDYMNKMLDRFDFKDKETKRVIEEARNITNSYIEEKQKG